MSMTRYEELMALMRDRYSCRDYDTARMPSKEDIDKVLEAARIAPSACNRQPWLFVTVSDQKGCEAVYKAYDRQWIRTAPMFIIALGNHNEAWHRASDGKDHTDVDVSIAVEHICLAATAMGLATCWVCNFDTDAIRKYFDIPAEWEPVAILPIGYPAAESAVPAKVRKDADAIICHESL